MYIYIYIYIYIYTHTERTFEIKFDRFEKTYNME